MIHRFYSESSTYVCTPIKACLLVSVSLAFLPGAFLAGAFLAGALLAGASWPGTFLAGRGIAIKSWSGPSSIAVATATTLLYHRCQTPSRTLSRTLRSHRYLIGPRLYHRCRTPGYFIAHFTSTNAARARTNAARAMPAIAIKSVLENPPFAYVCRSHAVPRRSNAARTCPA